MSPTDLLRDEHRVILGALDVLERAAAHEAAGTMVGDAWWTDAVAWFRAFADNTHHAKEEAALFPAMMKAGMPSEGGPIAVMLQEHDEGRRLLTVMDASAGAARRDACRAYLALLRAHIEKENEILFRLAEALLDEQAMQALHREFVVVEAELSATATVAAAEAALGRLAAALGAAA